MRTFLWALLTFAAVHTASPQTQAPPQTARQALLEMLLAKTPDAFGRHLPDGARTTLLRNIEASPIPVLQQLPLLRSRIAADGAELESFDVGPFLLTVDEKQSQRRIEIVVERDDLAGDGSEIELSLHSYLNGALEPMPVVPRLIVSMKQENDVWKLNEVTVAIHLPLTDPDYLKGLRKMQNTNLENSAIWNVRAINTAQISYSSAYPDRGVSCKLSKLGAGGQRPNPDHAMLIDSTLATGEESGYVFLVGGCDATPASKYWVTATPADPGSELRAFCSDESTVIRYSTNGKAATCLSEGVPLE